MKNNKFGIFLLGVMIFALIFGSAVCSAAEKGGELKAAYSEQPPSLDVAQTPSTSYIHGLVYDTLVYEWDGEYHGLLAESWDIKDDGKEVTFYLREGIEFHDGTDFNAEAVAFNFKRLMDPDFSSPGAGQLEAYEDIEVEDEYTVTMYFEKPISSLMYNLSQMFFGIQSPKAIEEYGEDYGQEAAIGTGPYVLKEWMPGDKMELSRNENYNHPPHYFENQGTPYIEEIILYNMPETTARLFALQKGDIHFTDITTEHIETINDTDDLELDKGTVNTVVYLGLNFSKEPWDNQLVRRAIGHTIDREEIVEQAIDGYGVVNPSPLGPGVLGHNKKLYDIAPSKDIEKGKMLLERAGYNETSDGWEDEKGEKLELEIWTYPEQPYTRLSQVIRDQIIKLGIDVEISTMESGTLLDKTPEGEHDSVLISYQWSDPDILTYFFHSNNLDRTNRVHYTNNVIDSLLDEAQTVVEQDRRVELYENIQKILMVDAAWINLYTPYDLVGKREELKGFKRDPRGDYLFHDAYIED